MTCWSWVCGVGGWCAGVGGGGCRFWRGVRGGGGCARRARDKRTNTHPRGRGDGKVVGRLLAKVYVRDGAKLRAWGGGGEGARRESDGKSCAAKRRGVRARLLLRGVRAAAAGRRNDPRRMQKRHKALALRALLLSTHLLGKDGRLESLPVLALCGLADAARRVLLDRELLVVARLVLHGCRLRAARSRRSLTSRLSFTACLPRAAPRRSFVECVRSGALAANSSCGYMLLLVVCVRAASWCWALQHSAARGAHRARVAARRKKKGGRGARAAQKTRSIDQQ